MDPSDYEMSPKVMASTRASRCNLGLWNLENTLETKEESSNTFAVG